MFIMPNAEWCLTYYHFEVAYIVYYVTQCSVQSSRDQRPSAWFIFISSVFVLITHETFTFISEYMEMAEKYIMSPDCILE